MIYRAFLSTHPYNMSGLQMIGHLINGKGKKVAGPTISGSFDGVLTAHMEDGYERKLWEKNWGPHGRDGRCVTCVSLWTDSRCHSWLLVINTYQSEGVGEPLRSLCSRMAGASGSSQLGITNTDSPALRLAEHQSSSQFRRNQQAGTLAAQPSSCQRIPARNMLPAAVLAGGC